MTEHPALCERCGKRNDECKCAPDLYEALKRSFDEGFANLDRILVRREPTRVDSIDALESDEGEGEYD